MNCCCVQLRYKKDILTERKAMLRKDEALLLTNESQRVEEGENEVLHLKDRGNTDLVQLAFWRTCPMR